MSPRDREDYLDRQIEDHEQHLKDLDKRLNQTDDALKEIAITTARIDERLRSLQDLFDGGRSLRNAMYIASFTIVAALIGVIGVLLAQPH